MNDVEVNICILSIGESGESQKLNAKSHFWFL